MSEPFPSELAGTWQSEGMAVPWTIVINHEGTIDQATMALGRTTIRPKETIQISTRDGQINTYKIGDCLVRYDSETRELAVHITIDHMDVHIGTINFEGSSHDIFWGKVNLEVTEWETTWARIYDYGPLLPFDGSKTERTLKFNKIQ